METGTDAAGWLAEGETRRARGDDAGAQQAFLEAARLAQFSYLPQVEAKAQLALGELRLLQDDTKGAREAFEQAWGRAMEAGEAEVEADAHFGFATASFDAGLSKDGHDELLEAMALYRELAERTGGREVKLKLARAVRLYGEHLGILGSEADAKAALELARIMFRDLGERALEESVAQELAALRDYAR